MKKFSRILVSVLIVAIITIAIVSTSYSIALNTRGLGFKNGYEIIASKTSDKSILFHVTQALESQANTSGLHELELRSECSDPISFSHADINQSVDDRIQQIDTIDNSGRKEITWDYAVESAEHGFNGTLYLTEKYGIYSLTPYFDVKNGASDNLVPALLEDSLSMYKITHNQTYLIYARAAANSLKEHMLNDKGIIRNYSRKAGANDSDPTDANYYLLPAIADLALYDRSYRPLAEKVANGIVLHGLSKKDIPYGAIYPNGTVADTKTGLPSNGGTHGTVSITIMGLLRTYQATENPVFLNKSRDILYSLWSNMRTKKDLIPRTFDSVSLRTIDNDAQLYATGELLRDYIYYYYLTHDPKIKNIIADYSTATYNSYWCKAKGDQGYFVYRVDTDKGSPSSPLLETNWHKLDMSLIYAGEITGQNYASRVYQDMDTFWLGSGIIYRNHLFRHGTNPNGSPAYNTQSLAYASMRTAIYVMLRMLNQRAFSPSDAVWNDKVYEHINATRFYHYHPYGYHKNVDVETFQPDPKYGLGLTSACDEFMSLVTLLFKTTPNIRMAWEIFPQGDCTLEPFSTSYSNDVALMKDVFLDYSHREIAFKKVFCKGKGKIFSTQNLSEVILDGKAYHNWKGNALDMPDGSHECVLVFEGGSYTPPTYP